MEVSQIKVVVSSDGIKETASSQNELAKSSENLEKAVDKLAAKQKMAAQLYGSSTEAQYKYKMEVAGGTQAQINYAAATGQSIDRLKAYSAAQAEATRMNNAMAESERQLAANQMKGDILKRAEEYRMLTAAQAEANTVQKQLTEQQRNWDASVRNSGSSMKALSSAHSEALAMNKQWDAGNRNATTGMGGLHGATTGFYRELLVLGHEVSQGNWKRFGGSLIVMGEYATGLTAKLALTWAAIAAGALVVFGFIGLIVKGAHEQKAMNDALIMTSNYAGETSDSLNRMAHNAVLAGGSLGEAKKVVTELAASGRYTGEQIQTIADSVVALEHATGQSSEKTIAQFATLSKEVIVHSTRASTVISDNALKLSASYHFMTLDLYNQITALEKQGDSIGASVVATNAFAEATKRMAHESEANLGSLARGWNNLKTVIGSIADIIGDIGKKSTAGTRQIEAIADVEKAKARVKDVNEPSIFGASRPEVIKEADDQLASARSRLAKASQEVLDIGLRSKALGEKAHTQQEATLAAQEVDAQIKKFKSLGKVNEELERYHENNKRIAAQDKNDYRLKPAFVKEQESLIRKANSPRATGVKGQDDSSADLQATLNLYRQEESETKKHYASLDKEADNYYAAGKISSEQLRDMRKQDALLEMFQLDAFHGTMIAKEKEYLAKKNLTPKDRKTHEGALKVLLEEQNGFYKANEDIKALEDAKYLKREHEKVAAVIALNDKLQNETARGSDQIREETAVMGLGAEVRKIVVAQMKVDYDTREAINISMAKGATANSKEITDLQKSAETRKVVIGLQEATLYYIAETDKLQQESQKNTFAEVATYIGTAEAKVEADRNYTLSVIGNVQQVSIARYNAAVEDGTVTYDMYSKMLSAAEAYNTAVAAINNNADKSLGTAKVDDLAKKWNTLGDTIGNSLTKGFGKGGKALGDMVKVASNSYGNMLKEDQAYSKTVEGISNNKSLSDSQRMEQFAAAAAQHNKNKVANEEATAASLIEIGKGVFDEQSRGYKVMVGVEKAFMALKIVAAVANMATDKSYTASSIAMSMARSAWHAIEAVLNQGKGDPYTAFGRMAAMAAVVAAIGFAVSGAKGGNTAPSAEERQASAGTGAGASFGERPDANGKYSTKSESVQKSLELLSNNSNIALTHTASMRDSLKSLVLNIGGVVNMIIRTNPRGQTDASLGFKAGFSGIYGSGGGIGSADPTGVMPKFIGGTTTSIHDYGYTFGSQSLADVKGTGLQGNSYTDINTEHSGLSKLWSGGGGVSREDLKDIDPILKQQFTKIVVGMADTVSEAAQTLGLLPADIETAMGKVNIGEILGDISLKGLDPAKYQQQLEAKFGLVGDTLAEAVMPGINKLSKVGEGSLTTLVRVATEFETVNYWLKTIGGSTIKTIGLEAATAADHLVSLAGGLDKFNEMMQTYEANAFTTQQQAEHKVNGANDAIDAVNGSAGFKDNGKAMPTNWEDYNKFVNGIDRTTEAGEKLWVDMMKLAPAFATVHGSAQQAIDAVKSFVDVMNSINGIEVNPQMAVDAAMSATTASMPWITDTAQLMTMTADDFSHYNVAQQGLIMTTLHAIDANNKYKDALSKANETYLEAVAKHNGASDLEIKKMQHKHELEGIAAFGVHNMAEATDAVYIASLHLTPAQLALVTAYIQTDDAIQDITKSAENLGISWGQISDAATTAFDKLMSDVSDSAKTLSGGDYGKELGLTATYLTQSLTVLTQKRDALLAKQGGMSYGSTDQVVSQEMEMVKGKIAEMTADLTRYTILEAQYKGHGKELLELEHWHKQQKDLMQGNSAALLLLEESYAKKRVDIINGTATSGLETLKTNLQKWLNDLKLNDSLSPLTAQQKLDEARNQYNVDLAKAKTGDATAMGDITKYAEAYLNAQKAVTGFAGDYSSVYALIQQQIGQLANPDGAPTGPATTNDIAQLKAEVVSLKETLGKTLEKLLSATVGQTDKVTTAIVDTGSASTLASNKANNLTAKA